MWLPCNAWNNAVTGLGDSVNVHTQDSLLNYTECCEKQKINLVSSSSADRKVLLMREVKGECLHWLDLTKDYSYSDNHSLLWKRLDHHSCKNKAWFHEHDDEFSELQWPPQSPDLYPVENFWDVVEEETGSRNVQLTSVEMM